MEKSQAMHEHVVGLSGLAVGITLALVEAGRIKVADVRGMLKLMYPYIAVTVSPEAARPIAYADQLLAGFESCGRDVRQPLSAFLALTLRERPDQRAAAVEWLSYATTEEITDELRDAVRALFGTKPTHPGGPPSGA